MKLSALLRGCAVVRTAGSADVSVTHLTHDSRQARPGSLFFALPGAKTDGNRHVKQACEAGAVAVVSELAPPPAPVSIPGTWVQVGDIAESMARMAHEFFGRPSEAMTVVGVTGTNGKTTTTYLLESVFAACGGVPAVAGTVEYRVAGRPPRRAVNTTPLSLELAALMAEFRDAGATHLAMEVSSHAVALKRVLGVEFDAAVFTNLSRDHLDFHKTVEDYFQAKAGLFDQLCAASSAKKRKVAVINHDDPRREALRRRLVGAREVLFGLSPEAPMRAEKLEVSKDGCRFDLVWEGRRLPARIALVGAHNVLNALAAAGAALGLGLPEDAVLRGLAGLARVPGRLEPIDEGQPFGVFVDYAHTDAALATVLAYLGQLPHRRLITVFGCGGDRDRGKRGPMGAAAARGSDLVFVTSDNPRSEDPAAILADIEAGLRTAGLKNYKILEDRAEAIEAAVAAAGPGDLVLIAGKGHEDYQILKDRTIRFDDREAARAAVRRGLK